MNYIFFYYPAMNSLPRELYDIIFRYLSSKTRSIICSVSSLFKSISINILTKNVYGISSDEKYIKKILKSNDYHSIVRMKEIFPINLPLACKYSNLDIIELLLRVSKNIDLDGRYWNRCFREACKNDILIVKLIINKGATQWERGVYDACISGKLHIAKFLVDKFIIHSDDNLNRKLATACNNKYLLIHLNSKIGFDMCWKYCNEIYQPVIESIINDGVSGYCSSCGRSVESHLNEDYLFEE